MAQYEPYRGQGQQGYGQSNPYGGGPSPYGQTGNPFQEDTSYGGGNSYAQGQYDRQGYEMNQMDTTNQNRILESCRQVDSDIDRLDQEQERLKELQAAYNHDDTSSMAEGSVGDAMVAQSKNLREQYGALVQSMRAIKSDKDSGNPRNAPQVGRVDRRVKQSMNQFQKLDTEFQRRQRKDLERQYKIVRPDASEAEVREAVQDPGQQIFSQALISSDRRGNAQTTLSAVKGRHKAIQKIEEDMVALAALYQDLDALVVQQEAAVTSIEARGEEVTDHVTKANVELDGAVKKARAARKKKWICLGIAVLIVIIIVIVVVVVVEVTKK